MQKVPVHVKSEGVDVFHWHEALDRTSVCMDMVDRLLLFHPAVESSETLKEKAEKAHQLLFELYQEISKLNVTKSGGK